jgi:signal transduction histidine kinase
MVDPLRITKNPAPPNVLIETAELNGRPYALNEQVVAPPGPGRLKFEYTALSLLVPERVRFKIQLEGFDKTWQDAGILRSSTYTNIPPGEYRFRVKACNNDGIWNETGASFAFRLKPHFYQTYWFYAMCLVGLIYVINGVQRFRFKQLRAREATLSLMVEERTRDLIVAQKQLQLSNLKLMESNETLEQRVQAGIDALREAERMAAYGNMVAGVAHEVRQPLFALQAAAYVLADKLKETPAVQQQLKTLDREARRMAALMDDLLEFARPAAPHLEETAPTAVLQDAVESFQASPQNNGIELKIDAAPDVPRVMMDRGRIQQVFTNLLINAQKHGGDTGRVTLSVDTVPLLPGEAKIKWIRFEVTDNGKGIPAEHLDHVFEPFYTTGKGTGLGLAIVHRIVTDHNGLIKVDSAPGEGAKFTIFLPA